MFRVRSVRPMRHVLVVAALAALGACSDQGATEPTETTAGRSLGGLLSSSPKLVECQTDETTSAFGTLDALGGAVSVGGTSVVFPGGAVLGPTTVRLTIPASRYVEIEVQANDEEHFTFEQPVVVTIDYSRCRRSELLARRLMVWHIDTETKALLENMEGVVDNKLLQRITFSTGHFSGYAIAF